MKQIRILHMTYTIIVLKLYEKGLRQDILSFFDHRQNNL